MFSHGKYPGCTTSVSAWMLSQIPQRSSITPSPAVRMRSFVLARLMSESGACTEYRASDRMAGLVVPEEIVESL